MIRLLIGALLLTSCAPARRAYVKAGDKAVDIHDYDTAVRQYKMALDKAPGNIEYRFALALNSCAPAMTSQCAWRG
jgi:hypothetical protein